MAGAFGAIVVVAAGATVLALERGRQNTVELVRDRTERIVAGVVERIRLHLDPVYVQSEFLSQFARKGRLDPESGAPFVEQLAAALAASPQVASLALIGLDYRQIRVERHAAGFTARVIDMQDVPGVEEALALARAAQGPRWGELVWSEQLKQPLVNLRTPFWRGESFAGELFATVTVTELSQFLSELPDAANTGAFVLYGRDHVLAHPTLARALVPAKRDQPLPRVDEIGDPVLAAMWSPAREAGTAKALIGSFSGHVVTVRDTPYVFVYRELAGYGDRAWVVGRYFPLAELESEVRRLIEAAWIGVALLAATVLIAWALGKAIGKPIERLALATTAVRNFDLAAARPLDRSRLREIDEAAVAYNALIAATHWFETYVPKRLVKRLIAQGGEAATLENRVLTVVFTDIAGFTGLAEEMSAAQTAEFLNHHFALIAACVESEGGTIDKFIGDAVMAFWGAPERQPDHAVRACRAVQAIAAAIAADNARRLAHGLRPVAVRIGVHTGPVIVGNIGAPGRINYTVVGDTVNTAQRLEQLGKEYLRDDQRLIALASANTVEALGERVALQCLGAHRLRGRDETTLVYRLV